MISCKKTLFVLFLILLSAVVSLNFHKWTLYEYHPGRYKAIKRALWFPSWATWTQHVCFDPKVDGYIERPPSEIGKLKKTTHLRIWPNYVEELPGEIGDMEQLKWFAMDNNPLTTLPPSIGRLKKLEYLNLRENQIRQLPDEIGQLENLKELVLAENQLQNLPSSIGNLKNLEELDVSNNNLTTLPSNISKLTKLKVLKLSGNPLSNSQIENFKIILPNIKIMFNDNKKDGIKPQDDIYPSPYNPNKKLIIKGQEAECRVYLQEDDQERFIMHILGPRGIQWSPDSSKVTITSHISSTETVHIINFSTGEHVQAEGQAQFIQSQQSPGYYSHVYTKSVIWYDNDSLIIAV